MHMNKGWSQARSWKLIYSDRREGRLYGYTCNYMVKIVGTCGSSLWITSIFSEIGSKILI